MANLSTQQIYALARSAGFSAGEAVTATAVALAESQGNPAAVGDTGIQTDKWGPSVGLWQVRTLKAERGKGTIRDYDWLMASPANQAKAAYQIRTGSNGWNNWSVFSSGKYQSNVTAVETTVGQQERVGGAQWWQKLTLIDNVVSGVTGTDNDDFQANLTAGVSESSSALANANKFLETVNSGNFWKRLGIGVGGALIVILAILIMVWAGKDKIIKSTVGSAVAGAVKGK